MDFFYRVFCCVEKNIWAEEFRAFVEKAELGLELLDVVEDEDKSDDLNAVPDKLLLNDEEGRAVACVSYVKKNDEDGVLADEIEEVQMLVEKMEPEINRAWVNEKLKEAVGCYIFQIMDDGQENENWAMLEEIFKWLRQETCGFEQADTGIVANENGAIVLLYDGEDEEDEDDDDDEDFDEELSTCVNENESDDDFEEIDEEELDDSEFDEFDDDVEDDEEEYAVFSEESDDDDELDEEAEEDDGNWEACDVALRVGDKWIEKKIQTNQEYDDFKNGKL